MRFFLSVCCAIGLSMTFGLDHQKDEDVPQAKLLIYSFLFLDGCKLFKNGTKYSKTDSFNHRSFMPLPAKICGAHLAMRSRRVCACLA